MKKSKYVKNLVTKSNFFSYETYIFDFDGTLVLSNQIKRDGFDMIAKEYENGLDIIAEILKNNKKANRFLIIEKFVDVICTNSNKWKNLYEKFIKTYEKYTVQKIVELKPINGSIELLSKLKMMGKKLYINSATPMKSLSLTLNRRNLNNNFEQILGGEDKKIENLKLIQSHSKSHKKRMIMIGDGLDDFQASETFNINFYPVGLELTGRPTDFSNLVI